MKTISNLPIMGSAILVCLLLTSPGMRGGPENVQKTLEDLDRAWGLAAVNGNWRAVQDILADDFVEVDSQGRVLNKGQDIEQLKVNPPLEHPAYESGEYVVLVLDQATAVMIHRATSTGERDGKQLSETHRSLHVFIKRGGRWQALATQETPIME